MRIKMAEKLCMMFLLGFLCLIFFLLLSGIYSAVKLMLSKECDSLTGNVSVNHNISNVEPNWEIIFQERRLKIATFCNKRQKKKKTRNRWRKEIYEDGRILQTKGNFSFCIPEKTGSSFLTMYLKTFLNGQNISSLSGKSHGELMFEIWHRKNLAPELQSMSELHLAKRQRMFPSFTVVRHPLHRLVSAWREKLGPLADGDVLFNKKQLGVPIIKKIRLGVDEESLRFINFDMAPVQLEELLLYINHTENDMDLDPHFQPLTIHKSRCCLCRHRFDYVLKLEEINNEMPFVLKKILGHGDFARLETPSDKQSISKLMNYVQQVPLKLVLDVLQRYKDDFQLFGYELPLNERDILKL